MTGESPSAKRETALQEMLKRLGNAMTKDERYNNGYAHHSLAVHSSYARAFEDRMALFVKDVTIEILEAVPVKENGKVPEDLIGKSLTINRSIFENTMTITSWIENFYQESTSINKVAREDQVIIGTKAFGVPVMIPAGTSLEEEQEED